MRYIMPMDQAKTLGPSGPGQSTFLGLPIAGAIAPDQLSPPCLSALWRAADVPPVAPGADPCLPVAVGATKEPGIAEVVVEDSHCAIAAEGLDNGLDSTEAQYGSIDHCDDPGGQGV